jgi:hypothetical protein
MRKFDKLYNLQKVNLLTEQRYLESKGLLKEEFKKGDKVVWVAPSEQIDQLTSVKNGDKGEYLGRDRGGDAVSFNGRNFYAAETKFELDNSNISDLKEGSESFGSIRLVNKNDFEKFIKSNPALGTIYDDENNRFKIYLYADLVGYFNPKLGRIDYEENSRFAKISDEYIWDRNINE